MTSLVNLVEQLRRERETDHLAIEAADTIERLTAALELSQSQNYCTLCGRALEPKP